MTATDAAKAPVVTVKTYVGVPKIWECTPSPPLGLGSVVCPVETPVVRDGLITVSNMVVSYVKTSGDIGVRRGSPKLGGLEPITMGRKMTT